MSAHNTPQDKWPDEWAEQNAEQLDAHNEEARSTEVARHAGRRNWRREPVAQPTSLTHDEHQGVKYALNPPKVLPGSHHYQEAEELSARLEHPLDVGPAKPYYSAGMSHGVEADPKHGGRPAPLPTERAEMEANAVSHEARYLRRPDPVPVYIVSEAQGNRPLTRSVLTNKIVQALGADPTLLVGKDPKRTSVKLLNESTSIAARLTFDPGVGALGALLPSSMTNYLEIKTQDEIWAVCASGSAAINISIINEYGVPGGS